MNNELSELFQQHHSWVVRACAQWLGSREDAEDAASEIFLRLPRALASYDRSQPFLNWFRKLVRNHCLDQLRRRQRERRYRGEVELDLVASRAESPLERLGREQRAKRLRMEMERLPDPYRTSLRLHYLEERSYEEICGLLRTPSGTLKSVLHRGRQKLATQLRGESAAVARRMPALPSPA